MANENTATPIRQQYLRIKERYPNAILFFRLGDFYETFDEDARVASRELDIVLTSRSMGKDQKVPMAGIPFHAAESYLARLIKKGSNIVFQMHYTTYGEEAKDRTKIGFVFAKEPGKKIVDDYVETRYPSRTRTPASS